MTEQQLARIRTILAAEPGICAAFLLGSSARGTPRPNSDVDIALLPISPGSLPPPHRAQLAANISAIVGREVDLGILDHRNLIYAKEACANGHCIHCRDPYHRDLFVATTLALYAKLREERQEVERAYRTR